MSNKLLRWVGGLEDIKLQREHKWNKLVKFVKFHEMSFPSGVCQGFLDSAERGELSIEKEEIKKFVLSSAAINSHRSDHNFCCALSIQHFYFSFVSEGL